MRAHAHYFRIGLFVIAATVLAILGVIFLGANTLFKEEVLVETYFDESIQGLDKGASVKYRGVSIGKVKEITFVQQYYETERPYIYVLMAIDPDRFDESLRENVDEIIKTRVERGLRVQWVGEGLTGLAHLGFDYLDAKNYRKPTLDWVPINHYIPSAQSAMERLSDAVETVFERVEKADIEGILEDLESLLASLSKQVNDVEIARVRDETLTLLKEVGQTNKRLQEILSSHEIDKIPGEATKTVAEAQEFISRSDAAVADAMKTFDGIAKRADRVISKIEEIVDSGDAQRGLANLARASDELSSTTVILPETVAMMNVTLRRIDKAMTRQERDVDEILDNLRRVTSDLAEFVREAKRNPSWTLFGNPPPPVEREKR